VVGAEHDTEIEDREKEIGAARQAFRSERKTEKARNRDHGEIWRQTKFRSETGTRAGDQARVLRSRAGKKIEEGKTRAADPLSAGRARPGRVAAEETWICVGNLAGELWIESGPCELNEIQDEEFATATKRKLVGVKNEELELRFRSYSTKAKEGK
jgi:hypothetical protein